MPRKNTKSRTDSAIAPTHRFAHRFSSAPERALSWAFQKTSSDVAPKYDSQKRADVIEDPLRLDVAELMLKDVWREYSQFSREDWRQDVADENTNFGYWQWLSGQLDEAEENED